MGSLVSSSGWCEARKDSTNWRVTQQITKKPLLQEKRMLVLGWSLDGAEEQWDLRVALSQGPQAPPLGLYFSIRPQLLPDES
ncbi:hypothetical protein Anapl_04192 [Anas platyrhynchos]|uniref:Uncharacterized protein n=1 Tax=Anas platyrhynchos TaxID=8839 RepID=R0JNL5_ANAPL|nr:hypothetical protein Anapl_04192 [Anas platyrhynchos]